MDEKTRKAIRKYPHRAVDIAESYDPKKIKSKEWLIEELDKIPFNPEWIYIAGSWYGNILVPKLLDLYPNITRIKLHDIDPEVPKIARGIFFPDIECLRADQQDSTQFIYEHMVINTSCEHMGVLNICSNSTVVLQSNNYKEVEDHINCVDSWQELADQYKLKDVYYGGELEFEKYKRFMVIGRT